MRYRQPQMKKHQDYLCTYSSEETFKAFRIIFEDARDPMLLVNSAGIFEQANAAAHLFFGKALTDLIGCELHDFLKEDTLPGLWSQLRARQVYKSRGTINIRGVGEGTSVQFAARGYLLPKHHLVTIFRDSIASALDANSSICDFDPDVPGLEIGKQLSLLKNVIANVEVAVARIYVYPHQQCKCVYLSPGCRLVFGYPVEVLKELTFWRSRIHPDDQNNFSDSLFEQIFANGKTTIEYRFRDASEQERRLVSAIASHYDATQSCWIVDVISQDISDRKQEQFQQQQLLQDLQRSERQFRSVFNQTFQLSSLLTPEGVVLEDNQTALNFCQIEPQDSIGRYFYELACWQVSDETQEQLKRAIATAARGQIVRYEVDIQTPQQTLCTIDFSLKPLLDESGHVELLIAEGRDITQQKQTMRSLQESKARFSTAFYGCPYPMVISTLEDGVIIEVNPSFCEATGFKQAEIVGQSSLDLNLWVNFDDRLKMAETLLAKGEIQSYEATFAMKSGELRIGLVSSRIIEIEQSPHVLSIINDVSDRKKAELALKDSEQRFKSVLENMPLLAVILDQAGRIKLCNNSFLELTGWTMEEVIHQSWLDRFVPPDLHSSVQAFFSASAVPETLLQQREYEIITRGGKRRLILWRHLPIHSEIEHQVEYACIGEDITERRRREVELQRQTVREQILADITRQMRQTLDLTTILATAISTIKRALIAERVVIFQFETPGAGRVVADSDSYPIVPQEKAVRVTTWLNRAGLPQSLKMLDVPILQSESQQERSLWGILIVYLRATDTYSVRENEALLRPLAEQLAIAIYQSELYNRVQRELLERQKIVSKFQHDSLHDALTGLYNRKALVEALEVLLDHWTDSFSILFLDLNRFKAVNDSYGHAAGDQLLQLVAQRLQSCVRENDMAVRLGGDEFVLLISPIVQTHDAVEVAQRVHQVLSAPIAFEFGKLSVSTSIGIAICDRPHRHPDELLAEADTAMYRAKRYQLDYVIY